MDLKIDEWLHITATKFIMKGATFSPWSCSCISHCNVLKTFSNYHTHYDEKCHTGLNTNFQWICTNNKCINKTFFILCNKEWLERRKEEMFYLMTHSMHYITVISASGIMIKNHIENETGHPLPRLCGLLFSNDNMGSFICTYTG